MAEEKENLVVPNNGDFADISGHESLSRKSATQLVINMDGYQWIITSETPIKVVEKEGYDGEEDEEEDE